MTASPRIMVNLGCLSSDNEDSLLITSLKRKMNLQSFIVRAFTQWKPPPPEVASRSKYNVVLTWNNPDLVFLTGGLLYRIERKQKIPPWVVEYCGSKTIRRIDNLEPCCPHKFRLRVIIRADTVDQLAEKAVQQYGSEENALERLRNELFKDINVVVEEADEIGSNTYVPATEKEDDVKVDERGDRKLERDEIYEGKQRSPKKKWLESKWSELMFTSTEFIGTSAVCFCMAVRRGYLKDVQSMLDERPELVGIINNTSGYTPLATAIRVGDLNMVKLLLSAGAEVDQRSTTGQTPLHIAVLSGYVDIADLLLEKGADFEARDKNDMRVEHYAVDSENLQMLQFVLDRGGDVTVQDNNCWTPLFRAVVESAPALIIEELVSRGSALDIYDRSGLSLHTVARLIVNSHGKPRHSVMRLVNAQHPRETAVANFTRLTKKISSVNTLLKPVSPCKGLKKN